MRLPREFAPAQVHNPNPAPHPTERLRAAVEDLTATAAEAADLVAEHPKEIAAGDALVCARASTAFARLDQLREEVARRVGCMALAPRAKVKEPKGRK